MFDGYMGRLWDENPSPNLDGEVGIYLIPNLKREVEIYLIPDLEGKVEICLSPNL